MTAAYSQFGRQLLEGLAAEERRVRLAELETELTGRLLSHRTWEDYWEEVRSIISDLKLVGHDLWRHDYDGQRRSLWGWDYMRLETAGCLQIQFDYDGPVKTFWRTESFRLGTETHEDEA